MATPAHSMSMSLEKIGRYEIVGEIGRGAMGVVYRAVDPNIGRTLALKTMRLDVSIFEGDEQARRFKNEARAAGLLSHPNIVTIFDADDASGLFYIAMEYLEGQTLESIMGKNKSLPIERATGILRQICMGLDYAHSKKVVHRDIKPANILVMHQGTVKIMDFGIAKAGGTMATSASAVLGTPSYMSPEQVSGRVLDGRSDLFSVGVMLYQMITGKRPFSGESLATVIYKIINEEPVAPHVLDASVHPGLSAVVAKCLAKDPEARYQNGAELIRDLERYKTLAEALEPTALLPSEELKQAIEMSGFFVAATKPPAREISGSGIRPPAPAIPPPGPPPPPAVGGSRFVGGPSLPAPSPAKPVPAPAAASPVIRAKTAAPRVLSESGGQTVYRQPQRNSGNAWTVIGIGILIIGLGVGGLEWYRDRAPQSPAMQLSSNSESAQGTAGESSPPTERPTKKVATAGAHSKEAGPTAYPSELRLTSVPSGASVQIDGHSDSRWVTPYTATNLAPGTHEMVFTLDGYSSETRKLKVKPGQAGYVVQLNPLQAALAISSTPAGAAISVDGEDSGKATPASLSLPPGSHAIELRKEGFEPKSLTTALEAGQTISLTPVLTPESPVPPGKGMLHLRTDPAGAQILINGKTIGKQTPVHGPMPPGDYQLAVRLGGYRPERRVLHIQEGQSTTLDIQLQPQ